MTKQQQRLINFLEEDIIKLKDNVEILIDYCNEYLGNTIEKDYNDREKDNPIDKIDDFFYYWEKHIDKLKPTKFDLFKNK